MGIFSRLEGGLDSAFDRAAGAVFRAPIEPAQIAKRAEKQMNREKLVGAGKQYAPTLYTVLVNPNDNRKLFSFYPTMAAEIETYLLGKGTQNGLKFDGRPLVRFIVDDQLKSGRFDVIAENVAAPIIAQLRDEELEFYGLKEPDEQEGAGRSGDEPGIAGASAVLPLAGAAGALGVAGGGALAAEVGAFGAGALGAGAGAAGALGAGTAGEPESGRSLSPSIPSAPHVASAPIGKARLTNHNAGKSYALTTTPVTLGRDSTCDIVINDANVSRRHAQLIQDAIGTWKLADLESTNGTMLNGNPIITALLRDGDQITLGVTVLEFRDM